MLEPGEPVILTIFSTQYRTQDDEKAGSFETDSAKSKGKKPKRQNRHRGTKASFQQQVHSQSLDN
jgi:hypothetical protein